MAIIRTLSLLSLLCLLLALPQGAAARPDNADRYLRRGVFVDGRVWLLTDQGSLFSIDERTRRRTDADLPDDVLDICRRDGQLLALTGERDARSWTVRRRSRGGSWAIIGLARSNAVERLQAVDCTAGTPITMLTTNQLIQLRPGGSTSVTLSELTYSRVGMTTFGTRDHLFVGLNSGEWGGGLRRIERATGRTIKIENESAGPCAGPLDTGCDPVQGITLLPWQPGCIAAAVGLVHFEPHGRLVAICGERVELLYSRGLTPGRRDSQQAANDNWPSVAFFGIVRSGDGLLAAGIDGLYRIGAEGLGSREPFPAFQQIAGVQLSLARPDVILAVTRINQRASVSGAVPLLIPR